MKSHSRKKNHPNKNESSRFAKASSNSKCSKITLNNISQNDHHKTIKRRTRRLIKLNSNKTLRFYCKKGLNEATQIIIPEPEQMPSPPERKKIPNSKNNTSKNTV